MGMNSYGQSPVIYPELWENQKVIALHFSSARPHLFFIMSVGFGGGLHVHILYFGNESTLCMYMHRYVKLSLGSCVAIIYGMSS